MHRASRSARVLLRRDGFSLVEMIGVLAIIAILAVIIVPKVFSTIASSRITQAAASTNAIKSSVTEFYGRFGQLPVTGGANRLDDLLVSQGLLDNRFMVKIGTQPVNPPVAGGVWTRNAAGVFAAAGGNNQAGQSRIICLNSNVAAPNTAVGANYQLDGVNNLPAGSKVVSAVIVNCTGKEANELSLRLDGESLSQTTATTADAAGKVVYAAPNAAGTTTAYIYLLHQ